MHLCRGLGERAGLGGGDEDYVADLLTLRRVPAHVFGTFTSVNPVWAALAGWVLLHQTLEINEWVGIGLIVAANMAVTARAALTPRARARSVRKSAGRSVTDAQATSEATG